MIHYRLRLIFLHVVLPFSEDFEIRVSDSRLDISTNSERKMDIYISKSKFGCGQPETNQNLKIEDVVIV